MQNVIEVTLGSLRFPAVHAYTEAVHGAFRSRPHFKLQQPSQSGSLASVIRGHGQVLQR